MCSGSAFVTTARYGFEFKKLLSLSSASKITFSLCSYFIFEPNCLLIAPIITLPSKRVANIALVVLLPCAPATANTRLPSKINGKASFRERQFIPRLLASTNLFGLIAAEYTTKSGFSIASIE